MSRHVASIATDLTVVLGSMHLGTLSPGLLPTAEAPAAMSWPATPGKRRLADRVRHRGQAIVQLGHELGGGIAHVSVPADPANATQTARSRRWVGFGSSRVLVGGVPIGACCCGGEVPTPLWACGDPRGWPVGDAPTSAFNSVVFGMSGEDVAAGWRG